jgi:hypothetical protein
MKRTHGRALAYAPQGFAQIATAADKGNFEIVLLNVVAVVCRRQHLGLVDVVDANRLKDLQDM